VNENIIIQPAAERDLADMADYLAERSLRAAIRFSHAVAETFKQLASMPEMGSLREYSHPALAGIRVWRVRGFKKYLIFYRSLPDGIQVIRVLYAARDIESLFEQ
jgi:toxin ParE1/3/4